MKGGVGKTTLALNLAVGWAKRLPRKRKLLLVDCDPQSNATLTMLDGQEADEPTLAEVLLGNVPAAAAIRPSRVPRIDLLPAAYTLADLPTTLADEMGRERRLSMALETLGDQYEACLIDAPAQLTLLSINILEACGELLVPADSSLYSVVGIAKLEEIVAQVRRFLGNDALRIVGIVLCKAANNGAAKDLERRLRERYGKTVLKTVIPASVEVDKAIARNRTVLESAPASTVAEKLDDLVTEILAHVRDKRNAPVQQRATNVA
jgi:chromosome partitioning protein